jgi:5'-3' exonuclease
MGVLKFQTWLRHKFPQFHGYTLQTVLPIGTVDRLLIDFNAMIHNAINDVYNTEDEEELQRMYSMSAGYWNEVADRIFDDIIELYEIVQPKRLIYIAADGPVMKAKLMQQRQRSYRAMGSQQPFNRNQVKPGTDFMASITERIRKRLKAWGDQGAKLEEARPYHIKFSDSYAEGEGEHKIMAELLQPTGKDRKAVDVIYSPDADVHFLSYLHGNMRPVIIMRQVHEVTDENKYEFFHVSQIKKEILTKLGFGSIEDFIVVSCFAGNDFVPALPFAKFGEGNGFDGIVQAYKKAFGFRTSPAIYKNKAIDWTVLYQYLVYLSMESDRYLLKATLSQQNNTSRYYNEETGEDRRSKILDWALTGTGKDATFNPRFFNERYKAYIFGTFHESDMKREEDVDFNSTAEQVHNYLESLVWVMSYYISQGSSVNHDWAYMFHYPPDILDVIGYLKVHAAHPTWVHVPLNTTIQTLNTPLEHLLAILKKEELWLLPPVVSTLFLTEMPELFPEHVNIDNTGIPFDVEGHEIVLVNYPSMTSIRNLFDVVRSDPSVVRVNVVRKHPVLVWTSTKKQKIPKK